MFTVQHCTQISNQSEPTGRRREHAHRYVSVFMVCLTARSEGDAENNICSTSRLRTSFDGDASTQSSNPQNRFVTDFVFTELAHTPHDADRTSTVPPRQGMLRPSV